jgi:hypothetical protein
MTLFDPKMPLFTPKIPLKLGIFSKNIIEKQYDNLKKINIFTF